RITEPLGMDETQVPDSPEGLSHGFTASGLPAAPWVMGGHAPAGAIRSSAHDMAIWLGAVRDGTAPGGEEASPRAGSDDSSRSFRHVARGAVRASAHDMAIGLGAERDGTAPGAAAAQPRTDCDDSNRIGWAWFTTTHRSPNLTWHNGGTGGYRSFLGFSAETG